MDDQHPNKECSSNLPVAIPMRTDGMNEIHQKNEEVLTENSQNPASKQNTRSTGVRHKVTVAT